MYGTVTYVEGWYTAQLHMKKTGIQHNYTCRRPVYGRVSHIKDWYPVQLIHEEGWYTYSYLHRSYTCSYTCRSYTCRRLVKKCSYTWRRLVHSTWYTVFSCLVEGWLVVNGYVNCSFMKIWKFSNIPIYLFIWCSTYFMDNLSSWWLYMRLGVVP